MVAEHVPADWPQPVIAAPDALPQIQAVRFSSLDVALGNDWSGEIIASSNTASLEITTNLFAFSVPRPKVGHFAFALHMIDVPPFFVRAYPLRIIARNAAGVKVEEDAPFRIRGR
ncbi:MAG: hypothetical protein ABSE64_09610 [Vulcanimicrobiaceae bacterium]